jgi:hypothetical protein
MSLLPDLLIPSGARDLLLVLREPILCEIKPLGILRLNEPNLLLS